MIGKTFGNYKFLKEIGEGGMGIVYLVEHTILGKQCAAKVFDLKLARKKDLVERFLREAKSQASLQHESIVRVEDYVEEGDIRFHVSEYIDGPNLAQYMSNRKKKMGIKEILRIMEGPIDALNFVHSKGIIHRDIKPSNILLDSEGKGHITDFGIAMILGLDQMTKTAIGMGTPHYMSPEQAISPRAIDHRSDIYSLGCILFEMAAAEPPFDGETSFQILERHKDEKPPIEKMNRKLPQYFINAVDKSLSKNPNERFAGFGEMLIALRGTATRPSKKYSTKNIINSNTPTDITTSNKNEELETPVKKRTSIIWIFVCIFLMALSILVIIFLKQFKEQKKLVEEARIENKRNTEQIEKQNRSIKEQGRIIKKYETQRTQRRNTEKERLEQQEAENKKKLEIEGKQQNDERAKEEKKKIEDDKLKIQAANLFAQISSTENQSSNLEIQDNKISPHSTLENSEENNLTLVQERNLDKKLVLEKKVEPEYPKKYIRLNKTRGINKTGSIRVSFIISPNGSVEDIKIIGGDNDEYFREEVIKALRQWKYQSPKYHDQNVRTQKVIDFKFEGTLK